MHIFLHNSLLEDFECMSSTEHFAELSVNYWFRAGGGARKQFLNDVNLISSLWANSPQRHEALPLMMGYSIRYFQFNEWKPVLSLANAGFWFSPLYSFAFITGTLNWKLAKTAALSFVWENQWEAKNSLCTETGSKHLNVFSVYSLFSSARL